VTHDINTARTVPDNIGLLYRRHLAMFGPREMLLSSNEPVVRQFLNAQRQGPIGMAEEKDAAELAAEGDQELPAIPPIPLQLFTSDGRDAQHPAPAPAPGCASTASSPRPAPSTATTSRSLSATAQPPAGTAPRRPRRPRATSRCRRPLRPPLPRRAGGAPVLRPRGATPARPLDATRAPAGAPSARPTPHLGARRRAPESRRRRPRSSGPTRRPSSTTGATTATKPRHPRSAPSEDS
jgi:hypothetical protein